MSSRAIRRPPYKVQVGQPGPFDGSLVYMCESGVRMTAGHGSTTAENVGYNATRKSVL
jgi:hypothetical protein